MKISLNLMKKITAFQKTYPDGGPDAQQFEDMLESHGFTVEKVTRIRKGVFELSQDDVVFDVSIPRNRTDLASQLWWAKEMCGIYHRSFEEFVTYIMYSPSNDWMNIEEPETDLWLTSSTPLCRMLCGRILHGVRLRHDTTQLVKDGLIANGMVPDHTVNDYVRYYERYFGQPMFALDADRLPSLKITVQESDRDGEIRFHNRIYSYQKGDAVLKSGESIIGAGGVVMSDSFLADLQSTNLVLLSFAFDREFVRRLSLRMGIDTMESVLGSTGCSPQDVVRAVTTLTGQIYDEADVERIEAQDIFNRYDMTRNNLMYTMDEINDLLSSDLTFEEIAPVLNGPELTTNREPSGVLTTSFPSYRRDCTVNDIAQDIVEYMGIDVIGRSSRRDIQ